MRSSIKSSPRWRLAIPLGLGTVLFLLSAPTAQAADSNQGRLILGAGLLSDGRTLGLQANGHMLFDFGKASLDLGLGEGLTYWGSVGSLFVGVRKPWNRDYYLRAGLAHHYVVPTGLFLSNPFGALFGFAPGIDHRSGFEMAIGLLGRRKGSRLLPAILRKRSRWIFDVALALMPQNRDVRWTTTLSLGTRLNTRKQGD